jgi:hypothetical protein
MHDWDNFFILAGHDGWHIAPTERRINLLRNFDVFIRHGFSPMRSTQRKARCR